MSEELHILVSESEIRERVIDMARKIDESYPQSRPGCAEQDRLIMICVLKGAFIFFGDLVRHMNARPVLDFIGMSSYGMNTSPGEVIDMTKDVTLELEGRDVLVVEDIVDTGHSMRFLLDRLLDRTPRSLRLCSLVDKQERRKADVTVDFSGFSLDGFIVGYGLDYAERYRELPAIYTLGISND